MLHAVGILALRLLVVAVATAGFAAVLGQIHDYPQTRQAISDFKNGDGLLWLVGFYFVNEAGSGIKYELTGNERHLGYFPRTEGSGDGEDSRRDYQLALYGARAGDWGEQVRVSHMLALGWGVETDLAGTVEWYLRSERSAIESG